jgi:hypothetical protein
MYSRLRFYGWSLTVAATAATVMLTGCGGSQMANPATQLNPQARMPLGDDVAKCNGGGPVKVSPCHIRFTNKNDQPITVSLKYPGDPKGKITERDNCGDRATIQGSGGSWTVTRGTKKGKCRAIFAYSSNGKDHGSAVLRIRNRERR